jgi:formylglycine-generating enzyme required for sulfatase activity
MEDSNDSCCSPQRPESSSGTTRQEFSTSALLSSANFVSIPAGEFLMGTDEPYYPTDGEGPSRSIWLDEFKISKFSVSNSEFASFIEATGYVTEAETYGWSYVFKGFIDETTVSKQLAGIASSAPWWLAIEGAYWFRPFGGSQTIEVLLDHPVVHVTHTDALEFCRWSGYKLPTEAQWEKASRGGLNGKLFPWGDELLEGQQHNTNIWQGEFPQLNTKEDGFPGTAPVNSFRPNNFGLHNTVGNIWEWTNDFWSARWHIPNTQETRKNPIGPHKDAGNRVLKGGSFMCHDSYCYRYRNSARTFNSPNTSTSHIGFRCVKPD